MGFGTVGVAVCMKAVAKNNEVQDFVPNWGKECGGVGVSGHRVGIDKYRVSCR